VKLNKQELQEIAKETLEQAWVFRATESDVMATWFLIAEDEVRIVGTPFDGDGSKAAAAEVIAAEVRDMAPVDSVLFVSDVWMMEIPRGTTNIRPPSQSPDACEALIVQCWSRRRSDDFALARRYRQNDQGELEKLDPNDEYMPGIDTGIFRPVVQAIRERSST
jgi:hypothetical protein